MSSSSYFLIYEFRTRSKLIYIMVSLHYEILKI